MTTIATRIGTFEIKKVNDKMTSLFKKGHKIADITIPWWDSDKLVSAIERNHILIEDKMKGIDGDNNAVELVDKLIGILGQQEKGFYLSRLKQIKNRLLS